MSALRKAKKGTAPDSKEARLQYHKIIEHIDSISIFVDQIDDEMIESFYLYGQIDDESLILEISQEHDGSLTQHTSKAAALPSLVREQHIRVPSERTPNNV